jgi:hypothetical protein
MEIIVDKRIELMAVIQTMVHYWDDLSLMYSKKKLFKCRYKEDAEKYFKKFKNHKTIKLYSELSNNVKDISTFTKLVLCYTNPPNLGSIANIENNINSLFKQNIQYENFINGIKRFYNDTDFEHFFESNRNEYELLINNYICRTDLNNYVNIIDAYLGSNTENYTIVISALLMGCFGIKILTNENITYNYSVISPYDYKENKYIFGNKFSVLDVFWHEIGHLTINYLTKSYINQFNTSQKIISNEFIKRFYTDIETVVNEYIVRAITIRLFEINYGYKIVENLIKYNIQNGFTEIDAIKNYITKNCEKDNKFTREERYKKLMDFVINII